MREERRGEVGKRGGGERWGRGERGGGGGREGGEEAVLSKILRTYCTTPLLNKKHFCTSK